MTLSIRQLSAGFSDKAILKDIDLQLPVDRVVGILGPAGVGKSTFLRTLSRWNEMLPRFWLRGEARLEGKDVLGLADRERAQRMLPLLSQRKRLYTASVLDNLLADLQDVESSRDRAKRVALAHSILRPFELWEELEPLLDEAVISLPVGTQRRIAIVRMLAGEASMLLADEPFRDIGSEEVAKIEELIQRALSRCGTLLVTHNQRIARAICDHVVLLVAGKVIESAPVEEFFNQPKDPLTQTFVKTGNCWPSEADMRTPKWRKKTSIPSDASSKKNLRPKSFAWILEDQLGGVQMPGLLRPLDQDLSAIHHLGCRSLVSLRYKQKVKQTDLDRYGITGHHMPIADMGAPETSATLDLCRWIEKSIKEGKPTVLHCKAGLGRTGTMLACYLVYSGARAVAAIERIRSINPLYIQSEVQVEHVSAFEKLLRPDSA